MTAIVDPELRELVGRILGDVTLMTGGAVDIELRYRPESWTLIIDGMTEVGPPDYMVPRIIEVANQRHAAGLVNRVGLHAASIETSAGVIALAGVSGAGKSTLAAAGVLAGHGYVADEISAVAVDPACSVDPFHRPIGLRSGGAAALGVEIPATSDGRYDSVYPWCPDAASRSDGGLLAGVAIVSRVESPDALAGQRITDVAPADALARLMQHCVVPSDPGGTGRATRQIEQSFGVVARLVELVPVVELAYSQPADGLQTLAELSERWKRLDSDR